MLKHMKVQKYEYTRFKARPIEYPCFFVSVDLKLVVM